MRQNRATTLVHKDGAWNLFDMMKRAFIFEHAVDEKTMRKQLMQDHDPGEIASGLMEERIERAREFGNATKPEGKWKTEQIIMNNTNGKHGKSLSVDECMERFLSNPQSAIITKHNAREEERTVEMELAL